MSATGETRDSEPKAPEEGAVTERHEERTVSSRLRPSALMLFEIVRREGAEELTRPSVSLFWSGVAAGLAISFSLAGVGMVYASTEPGALRTLLMPLGYVIGFLIVVFGRLQLFTENTIAAILPLAADFRAATLRRVLKLNGVVLAANLAGAALAALAIALTPVLEPDHLDGITAVAQKAMDRTWLETLTLGVPAGFLLQAMVWLMPAATGAVVFGVTTILYMLGICDF